MEVESLGDHHREDLVPEGVREHEGSPLEHHLPGLVGVPLGHLCQGNHYEVQVSRVVVKNAGLLGIDKRFVRASEADDVFLARLQDGILKSDLTANNSTPSVSISDESLHMGE